jgi:predicted metal-binding membrane protein
MAAVERALRRDRLLTILALAILVSLAWGWLLLGAGMDMEPHAALEPFPHRAGPAMPMDMPMGMDMAAPARWSLAGLLLAVSMWWVMMVAMMLPAAAPVILLYSRAALAGTDGTRAPVGHFLSGYLTVWGLFSLLAATLQLALLQLGAVAPTTIGSAARWFSAGVLIAAGLYQLSPLKSACLSHCRNPAQFLSRHYRPGRSGAFRMGVRHGAFCVGCCWLLMALLFVGGVMNLAWIALLTLLVAAEKLLPGGRMVAIVAGTALVGWGAVTALA